MFTGIVQAVGRIAAVAAARRRARAHASTPGALDPSDVAVGDSVAVSGCCLTVVAIDGPTLALRRVGGDAALHGRARRPARSIWKRRCDLSDRLGGHLMSGHVDGVGVVTRFERVGERRRRSCRLEIEAPAELARFIASKGSIAVDGVSLTVNAVAGRALFGQSDPAYTGGDDAGRLRAGARVNLEVD